MITVAPVKLGEPALRWSARAHSIAEIESELARIWASQDLTADMGGAPGRHIAARTSVMNLVVVARRPEIAERCAATIQALTGRHPSRTIVIGSADPDGPSWLDARVEAHCVLPREDAPETCAETIHVTCGGESGAHLAAIATPLIIHDLPVTVWWPGEPSLTSRPARDLLATADRLVVDGSTWSGDGLGRLRELAALQASSSLAISDFARRAQENKLKPDELQGGTFTISNGGVYGSLLSTPIVNPPQSGVLGMHAIQERPVARDGQVVIRPMMYVALTYDHRLVDGREAVTFLKRIKETIENPARMLIEV